MQIYERCNYQELNISLKQSHMDLRNLIPKNYPCYFIKSVTDHIDCSNANCEFDDTQHEFVHLHDYCLG